MQKPDSLYYEALHSKGGLILINKKHILYAHNISATDTEIALTNGDKFHVNIEFGTLMYHLGEVEHKSYDPTKG